MIWLPEGPFNALKVTLTLEAPPAASNIRLKFTTSLRPPNSLRVVPSQTLLRTEEGLDVARSSSWVTLSPPSLAHAAERPAACATSGRIQVDPMRAILRPHARSRRDPACKRLFSWADEIIKEEPGFLDGSDPSLRQL